MSGVFIEEVTHWDSSMGSGLWSPGMQLTSLCCSNYL